ncbi:hypothetical protein PRIPAC_77352, partial [Pristionchus pacificus]
RVRMSPIFVVLLLGCSSVLANHHYVQKPPKPAFDVGFQEFAENRTKAFNNNNLDDFAPEHDVGSALTKCPDYCKAKLGNGHCDEECNIDGCLADLGDCTTKRNCWELQCPSDGKCRPICEMNSCVPNPVCTTEQMKLRQIAVLVSPVATASAMIKMTPRVEYMLSSKAPDTFKEDLGGILAPEVVFQSNKQGPLVWGHKGDYLMEQVKYSPDKKSVIKGGCTYQKGSIAVISIRDPRDRMITYTDGIMDYLERFLFYRFQVVDVVLLAVPEAAMDGIWGWFDYTQLYRPWKIGQFRFLLTHEIHEEIDEKYIEDDILCGPTH